MGFYLTVKKYLPPGFVKLLIFAKNYYGMIYFGSDYMAGAHPVVMEALRATNLLHTSGYGNDNFTREAKRLILSECALPDGEVFFLVGGTQTNAAVIDRLLERNDGVIAADTAHISVHEAGAIELDGHKVLVLPNREGKLDAADVEGYISAFYADETHPHMVRPAMVYVSFPTELGTVYTQEELRSLHDVCVKWEIPLYVDGARMAYGLAAGCGISDLRSMASLCDVFYIGGTKCGALFGEAVVTGRPELFKRFFSLMKSHGAVLAKGRLLGVQFKALFEKGLYYRIGEEAVRLAVKLKKGFEERGFRIFMDSPTNQQFVILPDRLIDSMQEEVCFELWGPRGKNESVVRFVTDWTTKEEDITALFSLIDRLHPAGRSLS